MKVLKKIKRAGAVKTAKRVIKGWTQPTEKQAEKYAKLMQLKIIRESSEEFEDIVDSIRAFGFEGFESAFKRASKAQARKGNEIVSRIATVKALQALNITDKATRKAIFELTKKLNSQTTYSVEQGFEKQYTKNNFLRVVSEIENVLGKARTIIFVRRYCRVFYKISKQFAKTAKTS